MLHSICQQVWKTQEWPQVRKRSVFIPVPKKGNAKECSSESESHSVMSDSLRPHGLYCPWNSPGQNTGVGNISLLHGIFQTQGSKQCLLHFRQTLHQLSHKGNPKIKEWVAYPFSSRSSRLRDPIRVLLHCRWILYQLS